ncbi:MAG: peptidylprolyl isomerase, partial [Bacillota bacterium]|nr:peptidylprolyl isomerase [Bacillota bacterium]
SGMGGHGYGIKGEFLNNGVNNNLKHTKGVISMARSQSPNSAGSKFFTMHEDSTHLDGQYASFGKVVEGLDVVDEIAETSTSFGDKPVIEQKIESMTVDTKGKEYLQPEKL